MNLKEQVTWRIEFSVPMLVFLVKIEKERRRAEQCVWTRRGWVTGGSNGGKQEISTMVGWNITIRSTRDWPYEA